jgi:hypothetical protein
MQTVGYWREGICLMIGTEMKEDEAAVTVRWRCGEPWTQSYVIDFVSVDVVLEKSVLI